MIHHAFLGRFRDDVDVVALTGNQVFQKNSLRTGTAVEQILTQSIDHIIFIGGTNPPRTCCYDIVPMVMTRSSRIQKHPSKFGEGCEKNQAGTVGHD